MYLVLLFLGLIIAIVGGLMIHRACEDDSFPLLLGFVFIFLAFFCVFGLIEIAVRNSKYVVEALNGTLDYDTLSLEKDGKLLEIKIK